MSVSDTQWLHYFCTLFVISLATGYISRRIRACKNEILAELRKRDL